MVYSYVSARVEVIRHLSFEEVERRYRACMSVQDRRCWLIIRLACLPKRAGHGVGSRKLSPKDIGVIVGMSTQHVRKVIHSYNEKGPDKFLPSYGYGRRSPSAGRKSSLSEVQVRRLKSEIKSALEAPLLSSKWTAQQVQTWAEVEYDVHMSHSTAWRYLKRCLAD